MGIVGKVCFNIILKGVMYYCLYRLIGGKPILVLYKEVKAKRIREEKAKEEDRNSLSVELPDCVGA